MSLEPPRRFLARPALHVILALMFAGSFVWPMFAATSPSQTWWFLNIAWVLSWIALAAVAQGQPDTSADTESH